MTLTYSQKKRNEVYARDFIHDSKIHPTLTICNPDTPLGEFALKFLQNASAETLSDIYQECQFQNSARVSLTFCRKESSSSHEKIELNDSTITGINPHISSKVFRYGSPEYIHGTSYHYVSVEVL